MSFSSKYDLIINHTICSESQIGDYTGYMAIGMCTFLMTEAVAYNQPIILFHCGIEHIEGIARIIILQLKHLLSSQKR